MIENKMTHDELEKRLTAAPFHRWLGLKLLSMDEDGIKVGVTWREEFIVNPKGEYTHGGILATVIDTAADYALAAKLGAPIPTVDLRIDYHRPAMPGDLVVEARPIKLGASFSSAEAYVYDTKGKLLASGRGVYYSPPVK
jgi:uncharacterized protein (TIGR00369 family)